MLHVLTPSFPTRRHSDLRLVASHFTDNPASGAVLRNRGFRPTGRHPERASLGRSQTAPTIEYAREIAAPGNDGDGEDSPVAMPGLRWPEDRKSTRLNSSH